MCPNKKRSFNKAPRKKRTAYTKYMIVAVALIAIIAVVSVFYLNQAPKASGDLTGSTKVLLQTSMGNITIQLRTDKPITSENFRTLVEQGKYDGTAFHRIMAGFMIQGGVINGYTKTIPDEIGSNNNNVAYSVAMANTGQANSASSSFFINTADNSNAQFDATYTVFGNVIEGQNVVYAISQVPVGPNPQRPSENSSPLTPVTLIKASMLP
jgi:cyclophilin family peptidyl-prolyl cis-trans isomerase